MASNIPSVDDNAKNDPLDYCISVILKEAKREDRLVRQLMDVMLSTYTTNPLNLGINAPSGEGKNWALEKVAEKFPKEDIQFLSGMTEKALFHKKGVLVVKNEVGEYQAVDSIIKEIDLEIEIREAEMARTTDADLVKGLKSMIYEFEREKKEVYKNAVKLIDLNHKILIFLDTPPMGLLSALMSLLAHDKYEVEYEYVDTNNGIKTHTNILRGWPAVIYAQAIDYSKYERWPEVQRRFIITNPQMDSKEKYAEAIDLALDKYGLPDFVYQKTVSSDDEKNKVRMIVKGIKESMLNVSASLEPSAGKNLTFVPFNEAIKNGLPKDRSQEMNNGKRFGVILSLLAQINIDRRPRIKIVAKGDPIIKIVPLALFDDLRESIFLMEYSNGVRPYALEWYYKVFEPTYYAKTEVNSKVKVFNKGNQVVYEEKIAVNTTELIAATQKINSKSHTSNHLLQTFLYPLINQGYIDSQASEIDHRAHIYFPVVMKEKMLYYNNSDGHNNFLHLARMCIRDFTTFPSKPYLISRFDWFLKYYYEEGYRATIYDHEDKEISIEELIDRYYQKPEDYFTAKMPTDPPDNLGCNQGQDFDSTSEGISNNNISETPETGSSYSESVENMQNLDSPDDENEKKLLCQGALLQYNISESQIIENPAKSYSDYLVDGVPIWQLEHRGMTEQEAEAFRQDCERLNKLADKSS